MPFLASFIVTLALALAQATVASADCGVPLSEGTTPTATDALHILNAAVGATPCTLASCDVTGDCAISASDAAVVLVVAVGGQITLSCDAACPSAVTCEEAGAAVCNGTCPRGTACAVGAGGPVASDPRVTLCHGDPAETVTVSLGDLDEHIAHGDPLRRCEDLGDPAPPIGAALGFTGNGVAATCSCVPIMVPTTTSTTTTTTTTSTSTSVTLPDAPADDPDNDGLVNSVDPCPSQPLNECFGRVAIDSTVGLPVRINADTRFFHECSGNRIDCTGRIWLADFGYNSLFEGNVCDIDIGDVGCSIRNIPSIFGCTSDLTEDIFLCEHFTREPEIGLSYSFDLPNGSYLVNLLFANTFKRTRIVGSRVFDVAVEGLIVLDDFDQVAVAGGSRVALVRSALVEVVDGNGLQIEFGHVVENPTIKGIEVLAAGAQ